MAITSMEENLKDKIFWCSYGYDMTIPQFCKIVKDNGKTVLAIMLSKKIVEGNVDVGQVIPTDKVGMAFKLWKRKSENHDDIYLKGKFPEHSASEIWSEWDGTPQYENHMD